MAVPGFSAEMKRAAPAGFFFFRKPNPAWGGGVLPGGGTALPGRTKAFLGMWGDCAGDEIGFTRQDIAILANAGDFSVALEFAQSLSQRDTLIAFDAEFSRHLDFVERAIISRAEQRQDLFTNLTSVLRHMSERL